MILETLAIKSVGFAAENILATMEDNPIDHQFLQA